MSDKLPHLTHATGAPVSVTMTDRATLLRLPETGRDPIDTVVVLER